MILVQLYSLLFAVLLAYVNKVPCKKFIDVGTSIKEDKDFHRANLLIKVGFALFISKGIPVAFVLSGLWQWVIFDPVIAVMVYGWDKLFYIGDTATTDKLLRKYLKDYAGLIKILGVSSAILVINFFL